MIRSLHRPLAVSLLMLLLNGCASSLFRQPEVSLQGVQLGGLGLRGGTLLVNLRVINPNRFALRADGLQYDLALGDPDQVGDTTWVDFAAGRYEEPISVGAGDTANVPIPVEFSYSQLGSAASSILRSGTFRYRARGEVNVSTAFGRREVPFTKRGTVSLLSGEAR